MTKLTPIQDQILRAAAAAAVDGMIAVPKDWKTIQALTTKGLLTSTQIPEGGAALYITVEGYAALGEAPITPVQGEADGTEADEEEDAGSAVAPPTPKGKIAILVGLLQREEGATVEAMMAATGWQAHSVRGAMSGAVKKALGLTLDSEKRDGVRIYRIVEAAAA